MVDRLQQNLGKYPFVTLADVKNYLSISSDTQDTRITNAITYATGMVEHYIGQEILANDYVEIFDGGKTGYTSAAGYCLVGSAMRGDMRLVAVVLGSEDDKRFNDVSALMTYGFRHYDTVKLFDANESLRDVEIVAGKSESVSVGATDDIILTLTKDQRESIRYEVEVGTRILAPISATDQAGTLRVLDGDNNVLAETDLIYLEDVEELGFFQRLIAIIWNWIKSLFG